MASYSILDPEGEVVTPDKGFELLPRVRKIYDTFPQRFNYVNMAISRNQDTITPDANVLIGFLETSIMVYLLPSTKPVA